MSETSDSAGNAPEYSVTELSGSIRRTMEDAFGFVRVRGEISGWRGPHSSGHAYFSLKDERARIDAVAWKGTLSRLKHRPEEGLEVIATGKVSTFAGSSKYQLIIDNLEPAGAGALMALLEERRRRLAAEGLFDEARKQLLPFMPMVVGVVTSPTGAVIRDILHRIDDRFPVHVIAWPVRVQGETSADEVTRAIDGFNAMGGDGIPRPDVLIVARGGGSLEDLWSFNEEAVVRAAAASGIPLISAIGHETDWTLIDHAADRRAPTPTAAAEMAVPVKADLTATLATLDARLKNAMRLRLARDRDRLRGLSRGLPALDSLFSLPRQRLDRLAAALPQAMAWNTARRRRAFEQVSSRVRPDTLAKAMGEKRLSVREAGARMQRAMERRGDRLRNLVESRSARLPGVPARLGERVRRDRERVALLADRAARSLAAGVERRRRQVDGQGRLLGSLSYQGVLARGFAVIRDEGRKPVKSSAALGAGEAVTIEFSDGEVSAVTAGTAPLQPRKAVSRKGGGNQGSLF